MTMGTAPAQAAAGEPEVQCQPAVPSFGTPGAEFEKAIGAE